MQFMNFLNFTLKVLVFNHVQIFILMQNLKSNKQVWAEHSSEKLD